jgi:hypothetical protein
MLPVSAQPILYACASFTREYVVGAKLPPSGLFRRTAAAQWEHLGFNHPFLVTLDTGPGGALLLAAGNGLIRALLPDGPWTILTDEDVTELRDVVVDRTAPGTFYFAHTRGLRVTHDGGKTWIELGASLHRKYTEAIRVDHGALIAGTEEGIFRSEDQGRTWRLAGAAGFQILRIEESPHDGCFWLAATQQGGLFSSRDCGRTFENVGNLGVDRNLYDIAFDPATPGRIAVGGWGPGVAISLDNGKTWRERNAGLPGTAVTSVAFDPVHPGRLFAAVHEQAVYVSEDNGATWTRDGLDGGHVSRLRFIGDTRSR